jgi:hypothetical protein
MSAEPVSIDDYVFDAGLHTRPPASRTRHGKRTWYAPAPPPPAKPAPTEPQIVTEPRY